jgi:hypothetical protein
MDARKQDVTPYFRGEDEMKWPPSFLVPKNPIMKIQITYGWGRASFTCQTEAPAQQHIHLVIAYLLFISRYFYICDKRQIAPVRQVLTDHLQGLESPDQLAPAILEVVKASLGKGEKAAFDGQFKYPQLPPTMYVEAGEDIDRVERVGQYIFRIYKKRDQWLDDLQVSLGLDTVLLPITVGLLYHYVTDKIPSENRTVLDACIAELLASQASSNFRSLKDATQTVNKVIAENLIERANPKPTAMDTGR